MKLKFTVAIAALLQYGFSLAQHAEPCGTNHVLQQTLQNDANAAQRMEANWQAIDNYIQGNANRDDRNTIVTIPVVFHVIHSGQTLGLAANISAAQVQSQLDVLNECYRKRNADTALIPNIFKSRAADIEVEFCLAITDPNGNNTSGIMRYNIPTTPAAFDADVKPVTVWDATKYLNIWTTQLSNNILGYATFPGMGPMNQDGVVLDYRVVGKAPANPFTTSSDTLGKTAVHEVGHWLGLFHTFQDSCKGLTPATCGNQGDRVCDTPPSKEANYGTPSISLNSCNETPVDEPDMWMNYMDYANSENLSMFTHGQRDVMRAVLNTSRVSIQSSMGCVNAFDVFAYTGQVVDAESNQPVQGAKVLFDGAQDFEATTDANGNFTIPALITGYYNVYAGKWGYRENFFASHSYYFFGQITTVIPIKPRHYYDDFIMNFGWTSTQQSASAGLWTRDIPVGTAYQGAPANPSQDIQDDYGLKCFVTANNQGGASADDVDGGTVTLLSPVFDLSGFNDPYIRYYRWFYDGSQSGNAPDDNMLIKISAGAQQATIENVTGTENEWVQKTFRVSDIISPGSNMRVTIEVSDLNAGNPNIVEGGIDKFEILEAIALSTNDISDVSQLAVYPNPTTGTVNVMYEGNGEAVSVNVLNMLGQQVAYSTLQQSGLVNHNFDLSNQLPGLYFVQVLGQHFEKNVKISLIR